MGEGWFYDGMAIVLALGVAWIAHRMLEARRRDRNGPRAGDRRDHGG